MWQRPSFVKKYIFVSIILIFALAGFSTYQYFKFNDGKLHLIFCNVGQGDGIFIRSPKGLDIIVDSGPDDSILNCLSSHTPFWDREIELAILTHPHADHMRGFISIFQRYKVLNFATEELGNDTALYKELIKEVQNSGLKVQYLVAGDKFKISDGAEFKVVGPSKDFLKRTSPNGKIGESKEFSSLELLISLGTFNSLLAGDSQIEELNEALPALSKVDVFQIPHHGSKYGTSSEFLNSISPKLAVISVGKNKYGHPTKEVLGILESHKIKFLRTDQHGDVEIIVDKNGHFTVQ